jgi:hypothetical protein
LNTKAPVRGLLLAVAAALAMTTTTGTAFAQTSAAQTARPAIDGAGKATHVRHGRPLVLTGRVETSTAAPTVVLERALSGRRYRAIARSTALGDGSYRFKIRARRSASYRVSLPVSSPAVAVATASAARRIVVVARVTGRATRHVVGGERVTVRGRMRPALRGRVVRVQLRTRRGWQTVDKVRTRRGGRFKAAWRPHDIGRYRLRVRFAGDRNAAGAGDRLPRVHVYRGTHASWYGPGLYGNSTACGGALTPWRLGVAHRSLPCGTRVTFRYGSRSVTVPVIDRGPFAAGREWDLTAATKAKLGFGDVGVVWSTR